MVLVARGIGRQAADAAIEAGPRRRRSDRPAAVDAGELAAGSAPPAAGEPPLSRNADLAVYRLLAAHLDDTSDGGCDLIFVGDDEALAFARKMAEGNICIQVWSGTRLVGLVCGTGSTADGDVTSST